MIRFHEGGHAFDWSPASRVVYRASGGIIARDCYNLAQARAQARAYARMMRR